MVHLRNTIALHLATVCHSQLLDACSFLHAQHGLNHRGEQHGGAADAAQLRMKRRCCFPPSIEDHLTGLFRSAWRWESGQILGQPWMKRNSMGLLFGGWYHLKGKPVEVYWGYTRPSINWRFINPGRALHLNHLIASKKSNWAAWPDPACMLQEASPSSLNLAPTGTITNPRDMHGHQGGWSTMLRA